MARLTDILLGAAQGYAKGAKSGDNGIGLAEGFTSGYNTVQELEKQRLKKQAVQNLLNNTPGLSTEEKAFYETNPDEAFKTIVGEKIKNSLSPKSQTFNVRLSDINPSVKPELDREISVTPELYEKIADNVRRRQEFETTTNQKNRALDLLAERIKQSAGNQAAKKAQAQEKKNALQQAAVTQADRIINKVDQAMGKVGWTSAGLGAKMKDVPMTTAKDLAADLQTIKANLGFAELQAMRQSSPTGGALGQIAVQELENLQSVLTSLDQAQSPAQLKEHLGEVKRHYQNWKAAVQQAGTTENATGGNDDFSDIADFVNQ